MTWVWPGKSRGRGGSRGPSEDESGPGVGGMGDEEEGDERLHLSGRDKTESPSFDFCSVENGQVFQDCLHLFGCPLPIIITIYRCG